MDFSLSTFTVEINQIPTLVFQAKWATEADDIGFGWAKDHAQQISTKGSHGTDLPAVIKVRVARPDEKAAYEAEGTNTEFLCGGEDRLPRRSQFVILNPPSKRSSGLHRGTDDRAQRQNNLLDGCCSRLKKARRALLSGISVVVRPPHKSRNNKWPRKQ